MAFFKRKNSTTALTAPVSGTSIFDAATEQRIFAIGERLLDHSRARKQGWLSSAFWSDKLMDWAMQDEGFKIQLFRFVDTFPMTVTGKIQKFRIREIMIDELGLDTGSKVPDETRRQD